jgi:hypothetical protein
VIFLNQYFMLQHFSHQALVKSTIVGCLLVSSALIPLKSTVAKEQILTTPQAKTIAQQVRQDALAKEKLDNTAKIVQVERVGKGDIWMALLHETETRHTNS